MTKLSRSDLYSLERYTTERSAFSSRVVEHRNSRRVPLGEFAALWFEDRLTVQYRIQEILQVEHAAEADLIEEALVAYDPLIPDGSNLKATLLIAHTDIEQREGEPITLDGIEHRVYAEIEGLGRSFAIVEQARSRSEDSRIPTLHLLRFELTPDQIMAIRAGAEFGFGIHDDRMRVGHTLKRAQRAALLADLT